MMKSEHDIVRALAADISKRTTQEAIEWLQTLTACTLSGDDSGLKNVWEEICVQVQYNESFFWDAYIETVAQFVAGHVSLMKDYEQLALWIQTDPGLEWYCEHEDDRAAVPPIFEDDIAKIIVSEYVLPAAEEWSNSRIEAFLERQYLG